MKKKDISKIPKGHYCYDKKGKCPYWSIKKGLPEQYNGYCSYLEKSDLDINFDTELSDPKTGKIISKVGEMPPFPVGLLWDQCKECDINNEE